MFGRATIWLGILVLSILYWFRDWTPRLTSRKIDKQQARASIDWVKVFYVPLDTKWAISETFFLANLLA